MHSRTHRHDFRPAGRGTAVRLRAYLASRSTEHWIFFAAGFVAAAILT